MNPTKVNTPQTRPDAKPTEPVANADKGKRNLNFDLKKITPKLKKYSQKLTAHLSFIVILLVLLVYLLVVWQIKGLATAEPPPEAESQAQLSTKIPKIDKKAIERIQSLEQNSPQIRSLFDKARNNPFHE